MLFGDYRVQVWDENLSSMLDREYFCRGYGSALLTAIDIRSLPSFENFEIYYRNGNGIELVDSLKNKENKEEKKEIYAHIKLMKEWFEPWTNLQEVEFVQDRGCQVSLSITGHEAPLEIKKSFDPEKIFRQYLLVEYPFQSKTLKCTIGGNTCIDYTHRDGDKGHNIARYIKEKGWNLKECVYYGDSLFPGGNDESVIGVIETVKVRNPQDLLDILIKS